MIGTIAKSDIIAIGTKYDGGSIGFAVALETFPNGGSVIERGCGGSQGKSAIRIFVNGREQASGVIVQIVVFLGPIVGGSQVKILVFVREIEVPGKGAKVNSIFGILKSRHGCGAVGVAYVVVNIALLWKLDDCENNK